MTCISPRHGRRAVRCIVLSAWLVASLGALLPCRTARAEPPSTEVPSPSSPPPPTDTPPSPDAAARASAPPAPVAAPSRPGGPEGEALSYETVVTASRAPQDARFVGSSLTVVTDRQIEALQLRTVQDALRLVPGVDIARYGSPGAATSAYVRGAGPGQTLVLLDGVDVMDPSDFAGAANLADFTTDDLERIEVLRGPASSLYGSSALGGVINLITRRGRGPMAAELKAEGGSFGTFGGWASVRGGGRDGHYAASVSRVGMGTAETEGAAASSLNPYRLFTVSGRAGLSRFAPLETDLALRYSDSSYGLYTFRDGRPATDPNYTQSARQLLVRPSVRLSLLDERWTQDASASVSWNARGTDNLADTADPSTGHDRYRGLRLSADWQHDVKVAEGNRAMVVFAARHDQASTEQSFFGVDSTFPRRSARTWSVAVQDSQRILDLLEVRASGRLDAHAHFGEAWTYTVAASHEVPRLRTLLRTSWGTAFKAPTLLQLFDPTYGNSKLKPERSRSFEAGFAQPLFSRRVTFGAAFFSSDVEDLMGMDPTSFESINVGSARLSGLESFVELKQGPARVRLDHTWMRPVDRETKSDLLRRPRHKASLWADVSGPEGSLLGAGLRYVGRRQDTDFTLPPPSRATMDEYVVASLAASYPLAEGVLLGARVDNLFGQSYEDVLGYEAPGLGAFANLTIRR